ncbi:MAG: DUF4340 domain-containing protein [Phycisphaerae bacterium]|nr:DUF4340 domain-containing protein [Phycisphaerae bacterium]
MRVARTLIVWAIAAALGGAWWSLRGAVASRGADRSASAPVFADSDEIAVESIDHIRLARRGAEVMEFRRANGRWMQTAPFPIDLDDWSARQLAQLAASLVRMHEVPLAESDAKALGFAPPVATLVLEGAGRSWTLEFGKRGVAGRAFARRVDAPHPGATSALTASPIMVIEGPLYERTVEADPREWRSRSLFPDALGRAKTISWNVGDAKIELGREGDRWQLRSPIKARADKERVEELVAGIVRTRSDGFLADAPKDLTTFGLASPAASISVVFDGDEGSATRTLKIGGLLGVGTNDRYAAIDGVASVMRISAGTQAVLLPRIETLIDPSGSGARPADVKRIEVRPKNSDAFEFVRDLDRWTASRIVGGVTSPAIAIPSEGPERLLKQLCVDRAPELALGTFPAAMEVAQVLLFGFDQRPLDVVRVAKDTKTGKWGFENGDGALRIHPGGTPVVLLADDFGVPK